MENTNYIAATTDPLVLSLSYEQLLSIRSEIGIAVSLVLPKGKKLEQMIRMVEEEIEKITKAPASTQDETAKRDNSLIAWELGLKLIKDQKKVFKNGFACYVVVRPVSTVFYTDANVLATVIDPAEPLYRLFVSSGSQLEVWPLREGIDPSQRVGILTIDNGRSVFAVIEQGNYRVINTIAVDLPKKHGRGGASSLRFARIRAEKRNMYLKLLAGAIFTHFFDDDIPNICRLFIFGDPNKNIEATHMKDPSAVERLPRLPIVRSTLPEGTPITPDATAAVIFEELQLKNHLKDELKEHPKIALLFSKSREPQTRVVLGAEETNFYLTQGLVSEVVLTKTSCVQFGVRVHDKVHIGFAEPSLLHSIAMNAPERYTQKLAGQSSIESYFRTVVEAMDEPPKLLLVEDKTPLSKALSVAFKGVGCILVPNCSVQLPADSQTTAAFEALGCFTSSEMI